MMRETTIKTLYQKGASLQAIADRDGRSIFTIRAILRQMRVKIRPRGRQAAPR